MSNDDSGAFNIEIDVDSGVITLTKPSGHAYTYEVQELEGKQILNNLESGGAQITVYSQKETFTKREYEERFGEL
jgi:hypothetical protein